MAIIDKRETIKQMVKDPEQFLVDKYYRSHIPKGFRIELFAARKYTSTINKIKGLKHTCRDGKKSWLDKKKILEVSHFNKLWKIIKNVPSIRTPQKVFCPCCEKRVVPKRLHKLDVGDAVLFFFTAGFWGILLFIMSLFVRRCPTCNYSLRGFKPLPKQ